MNQAMFETARRICQRAYDSVKPEGAVSRWVTLAEPNELHINDRVHDLSKINHIYVVGAGKADLGMTEALHGILGDRITAGFVNVNGLTQAQQAAATDEVLQTQDEGAVPLFRVGAVQILPACHLKPNETGVVGVRRMLNLVSDATADDLIIALISGGGSDLMGCPVEGLTLEEIQLTSAALKSHKLDIGEVNSVRKHLDAAKGGKLRAAARQVGSFVTLALSDVPVVRSAAGLRFDPPDVIASGPTTGDHSTYADAWEVTKSHELGAIVPVDVLRYLEAGRDGLQTIELKGRVVEVQPENPRENDALFSEGPSQFVLVGNNRQAVCGALAEAKGSGFEPLVIDEPMSSEVGAMAEGHFGIDSTAGCY